MNKLLFSEGGQPLHLDDLEFLQTAMHKAMQGIISPVGNCILNGVDFEYEDNHVYWEDGYLHINGKFCFLAKGNMSTANGGAVYATVSTNDNGNKTFEDGVERATRRLYTAEIRVGVLPDSEDILPLYNLNPREQIPSTFKDKVKSWIISQDSLSVTSNYDSIAIYAERIRIGGVISFINVTVNVMSDVQLTKEFVGRIGETYMPRCRAFACCTTRGLTADFLFQINSEATISLIEIDGRHVTLLKRGNYQFSIPLYYL